MQETVSTTLRETLRAWIASVSAALAVNGPIPEMREMVFITEGGTTHGREVVQADYYELVKTNTDEVLNLAATNAILAVAQEFAPIGDVLLADGSGLRRPVNEQKLHLFLNYLLIFAAEYFNRIDFANISNKTIVVEEAYVQTFDLLAQSIFEFEAIPVRWLVQFDNLRMDVETLKIESGVHLRQPSDAERNQALQARFGISPSGQFVRQLTNPNPARLLDVRDSSDIPNVFLEVIDHRRFPRNRISADSALAFGQRMLTALRLVQPHDVGIHSIWYVDENPFGRLQFPRWLWREPLPYDTRGAQAVVSSDVQRQIQEIWSHLAKSRDSTLDLAIRRLNDSYHRPRLDDRHIDYWIALEALFLREEEGELKYRAALLTARYVGVDLTERLDLFEEIKKSYVLRSKFVHGAKPPKSYDVTKIIDETGSLLRRVLRLCIINGHSPNLDLLRNELLADTHRNC